MMLKYLLLLFTGNLLCLALYAQKGKNQLQVLAEIPVPVYQKDFGLGGFMKGLYGVGNSGQITLSAGISKFHAKHDVEIVQTTTRLIPVLVGYRHNMKKIFVEPQLGYGELGGKTKLSGDYARQSVGAYFWALGAGIHIRRFDAGLRYQNAHGAEGTAAGNWHNKAFHYVGMHLGFNLL